MSERTSDTQTPDHDVSADDLCFLANSFAKQGEYPKAIQLYETACRLFPENVALKINLGRIRDMHNQTLQSPEDFLPTQSPVQAGNEVLHHRIQGLGEILIRSGRIREAEQIFEASKLSNSKTFAPYYNLGRLYVEKKEFHRAVSELEEARNLNPFHIEVLKLLGRAYFATRDYDAAMETWTDGLIIAADHFPHDRKIFRDLVNKAQEKRTGFTERMRNEIIRKRQNHLHDLFESLRDQFDDREKTNEQEVKNWGEFEAGGAQESPPSELEEAVDEEQESDRQRIARKLKNHLVFKNLDERDLLRIANFTSEISIRESSYVYHENDPVFGLYFIDRGKIELNKNTPYGKIEFSVFEKGSFFGDDSLLNSKERFSAAEAIEESDLLFLDKAGLAMIFAREKRLAIHFLWYFWKSLSFQVRESNERMTQFFNQSGNTAAKKILSSSGGKGGTSTHVEINKKLEVLQSKGLTAKELRHIARLSNEEIYNKGETIFKEGDPGDRLYIVLEGSVLISKDISGVGEEALSHLKKGDFFGEMALAGNEHSRSADAKAEEQGTTLLVITRQALREILAIDSTSAYQFLTILCRILSQRLLEMSEKIFQWKLMAGSFE